MSKKKNKRSEGDEVEELLRASEDELLLNLSVDSHMSRVSPSYIDADLDRRFQALKFSSSTSSKTNPSPQNPKLKDPVPVSKNVGTPQQPRLDADDDDLLARFAALKGSISEGTVTAADGDADDDDDDEDEVEKVIRWAMDAVRLENSPPTDRVAPENGK